MGRERQETLVLDDVVEEPGDEQRADPAGDTAELMCTIEVDAVPREEPRDGPTNPVMQALEGPTKQFQVPRELLDAARGAQTGAPRQGWIEFEAELGADGALQLPEEVRASLAPAGGARRVVVRIAPVED